MGKKKAQLDPGVKMVCRNKRALRDYHIEDTIEAGMQLTGTEVKSLRAGRADISDAYGQFKDGEIFLIGAHIAPYEKASHFNHEPKRSRKLLIQKRVIMKLGVKLNERGYTLVPLEIYFRDGWAKVKLGLAKGRKQHDNRDLILKKEQRREMRDQER